MQEEFERIAASYGDGWDVGDVLPYHRSTCFGCGPDNSQGLQVRSVVDGPNSVRADLVLDERFVGAPGVAHGGVIAAVFDDVLGSVILLSLTPAVTRELNVTYRRRVRLDEPVTVRARLDDRDGRTLFLSGELAQGDQVAATVVSVFVEVDPGMLGSA